MTWTRRHFLSTATALPFARHAAGQARLPNIVYVLADDLGWGDLGCYNPESDVPTPYADRLASRGVRFTDMHSPSSVCTPTRYGVLTGRYCWRTHLKEGVLWGYSPNLIEPGRTTAASLLKSAGYHTAAVGKWHLGLGDSEKTDYSKPLRPGPLDHGFDYFFGIPASLDMDPYVYVENDRVAEAPSGYTTGLKSPRGVFWRPGPIAPGFVIDEVLPTLADKATGYIKQRAAERDKPFFLYFPLTAPHTPWVPQQPYWGKSKAGDYGDFVAQVDAVLGQVMQTLEDNGLADNTLLIFTSDNGADWKPGDQERFAHRANAHWRGMKADVWEAGHRVPLLARWPGRIQPGSTSHALGCLTDLLATAAEITGRQLPRDAGEDSFSLLRDLTGSGSAPAREAVVHHSMDGMFSIRQGEWKLCLGRGSGGFSTPRRIEPNPGEPPGQLYHILGDQRETENLYHERPEVVNRLTALLEKYKKEGHSRPL
jgi:arylsulfatase A-like enzyme